MKVCLINPKGLKSCEISFPQGLLQISAELRKRGNYSKIIDFNNPKTKVTYDYLNSFDVVGLSVMTTQLKHATEIAANLDKKVKVVWGGVHCLLDPLSIVNRYKDHFVVSGEGEMPLVQLIEYFKGEKTLDDISRQKGISYFSGRAVISEPYFVKDLDTLTDIDYYELDNLDDYIYQDIYYFREPMKIRSLAVLVARCCYWDCSFCINSIYRKHGAYHRSKSIEKIKREISRIVKEKDINVIFLQDEDFFGNSEIINNWMNYSRENKILWAANCRYSYFKDNLINERKLQDLVASGLFCVGMSIEAGEEGLRNKVLNKQLKDAEIMHAVDTIKRSVGRRLSVNTSFIIDFPGDTKENKIKIIKWMDYLSNNLNIVFSGPQVYRPYPGSRLYGDNHQSGDIDYYMKNITESGAEKKNVVSIFGSLFYSSLLQMLFNNRYNFLQLYKESGVTRIRLLKRKLRPDKIMFQSLFITVRLRMMCNYWRLFFEPYLLGVMFYLFKKFRKAIN